MVNIFLNKFSNYILGEGSGDGFELLTIKFIIKLILKTKLDLSKLINQLALIAELNDGAIEFGNLIFTESGSRKKRRYFYK